MKRPKSLFHRRAVLAFCLPLLAAACGKRPATTPTTAPPDGTICAPECVPARGRIERRPVLTLSDHGGLGSAYDHTGVPAFILYQDGRVLFVDGEGEAGRVMQANLSEAEVEAILDRAVAIVDDLPEDIVDHIATDQPRATIAVVHGNRRYETTLEGFGRDELTAAAAKAPGFTQLYRELLAFEHDDAVPWQPDELAVAMYNADDRKDEGSAWPSALPLPPEGARQPPDLAHPNGRSRYPQPITYRIDGRLEADATEALASLGEIPIVRHGGHKWIVRTRRVVPGTGTWAMR